MEIESSVGGSDLSSQLLHHGAAANSSSKATTCLPSLDDDESQEGSAEIVYASHSLLNVAHRVEVQIGTKKETVWTVHQTLRTSSQGSTNANTTVSTYTAKRVISCVDRLRGSGADVTTIICGFTDGTVSTWRRQNNKHWIETVLVKADDHDHWDGRSVTDIAGMQKQHDQYCIVTCSSGGAVQYLVQLTSTKEISSMERTHLISTPANAVRIHNVASQPNVSLLLVGSAAPRNNKIHVFAMYSDVANSAVLLTHYSGALSGHEDWVTCFDWRSTGSVDHLASGSQDARIRLWKFSTISSPDSILVENHQIPELSTTTEGGDDEEEDNHEVEVDEGESRLEVVVPHTSKTSVTLEALLIGHEEGVTSVAWHPNPKPIYGEDMILVSSSMDRSIFIWSEVSGIWAPVSRVGSAGGILGGSIGSSLLGFLNIQLEPRDGRWMMGQGYGGALHFFSCEPGNCDDNISVEERAALAPWKAQPCLTGHFADVTDLCWESTAGDYLLTVSNDHTCRAWASLAVTNAVPLEKEEVWVEIARPQVHGYSISAIASVSTKDRRHLLVSGADEKELRVFDATKTFITLLGKLCHSEEDEASHRVDLAFIPSLGLSNKASAAEGAEQDSSGVSESNTQLPLERDLGAVSLWPEIQKLYGHNTELFRLTSTAASNVGTENDITPKDTIVASSARARDAEAACIRLWNITENRCLQVLTGGHRSTVTAMCFSPDANHLVTSGKDRRLCVWSRINDEFTLSCAMDMAHRRIVWGTHFCPFDSSVFATCSRDGSIKIWKLSNTDGSNQVLQETAAFSSRTLLASGKPESVTSVAFAPRPVSTGTRSVALLAVGLENGIVELWYVPLEAIHGSPATAYVLPADHCHNAAVTKLAWRPQNESTQGEDFVLAGASSDHGCRIWRILRSHEQFINI